MSYTCYTGCVVCDSVCGIYSTPGLFPQNTECLEGGHFIVSNFIHLCFVCSIESPAAGAVKFNIPKRPYVMTGPNLPPVEQPSGLNLSPGSPAGANTASGAAPMR